MEQEKNQELTQELTQEQETNQEQKKGDKSFRFGMPLLILAIIVGAFLYTRTLVDPDISVDGKKIDIHMTVQELLDAGFAIDDSIVGNGDLDVTKEPDIPGESYTSEFYYLYTKDQNGYYEYANIVFHVFNKDVNSVEFKNSKVYAYRFDPSCQLSKASVLINDINFVGMSKEEAIAAFEDLGVKFDKNKKQEFINGDRAFLSGKSGSYSFIIETDVDKVTVTNIEIKLDL